MTSRLASVTFKMASKVFFEETHKNFDFITEIPFRFLGFGDSKVSIVIENKIYVRFWNDMSSGVMNFKDSFLSSSQFYGRSYRPVTLLRASAQQD